jgi:hypothetical protein
MCAPFFSPSQLPYFINQQHNSQVLQAPEPIVQCFPVPTQLAYETLKRTNKPFPSEKSFSHQLQQFPTCKAFLMEQSSIMSSNSSMQ